jgi:hypothetical protein
MVIETTVLIVVTNTLADLIRARVDPARALSRVAREAWGVGREAKGAQRVPLGGRAKRLLRPRQGWLLDPRARIAAGGLRRDSRATRRR